jgi:hypothetical protein
LGCSRRVVPLLHQFRKRTPQQKSSF